MPLRRTASTLRQVGVAAGLAVLVSALSAPAAAAEPASTRGGHRLRALRNKVAVQKSKLYGRSVALVVGVDDYAHMPELTGAERDASRVAQLLRKRGFHVRLLLGAQATRTAILSALEAVVEERLKPRDRLIVYFAGHGISRKQSGGSMGFLMPVDARPDKPISQGIEMAWFQRVIATEIKARHVLFIADACYSGLAIGHRGAPKSSRVPGYVRMIAEGRMRGALVAGTAGQEAHEFRGHGLFTYYLLQGMRGAADTQKPFGVVTSQELASYVRSHVAEQASVHGWQQTPQYRGEGEGEFLFFVGGQGKPPPGLKITVSSSASRAPAPRARLRWALGGLTLVAAGAAATFGVLASQAAHRYERYDVGDGTFRLPATYSDARFLDDVATYDTRRTLAWVSGGVAGASLVALAATWLLGDAKGAGVALAPRAGGATLRVQF